MRFTSGIGSAIRGAAKSKVPQAYLRSAITGPFRAMTNPLKFLGEIKGGVKSIPGALGNGKSMSDLGRQSATLLGTAAGFTYVSRAIRGKSPFRTKGDRRDILPWIPFI